jgi:hypothetical protein
MKQLKTKIQSLKQIIKELDQLENNDSAEITSQLLKIMISLIEEIDQRLKVLEKEK